MPLRVIECNGSRFMVEFDEERRAIFWLDEKGLHVKDRAYVERTVSFEDLKSTSDGQLTLNLV